MGAQADRRRALLLAAAAEAGALEGLLGLGGPPGWEAVVVDSFEQAHFRQQLDPCDAVLLDGSRFRSAEDRSGLSWLAAGRTGPVLLLADAGPEAVRHALEGGADLWLPRAAAAAHPPLLTAGLERLARQAERRRDDGPLGDSRRQVDRLVGLLWQTLPADGQAPWFTQRYMLERLHEEVHRSARHGGPLAVVLGEVTSPRDEAVELLAAWAATRVARAKRRCDVAGQYGPAGFMLLLPQTTQHGAAGCCRRLRALLGPDGGAAGAPRPRFGLAAFAPGATAASLLCRAEEELERARSDGVVA
jgi:PleD family two-component response regulator